MHAVALIGERVGVVENTYEHEEREHAAVEAQEEAVMTGMETLMSCLLDPVAAGASVFDVVAAIAAVLSPHASCYKSAADLSRGFAVVHAEYYFASAAAAAEQ